MRSGKLIVAFALVALGASRSSCMGLRKQRLDGILRGIKVEEQPNAFKPDRHEEEARNLRRHVPKDDDYLFTRAESLEYFRNGIDPSLFEWVNKEEIGPGNTTCGFLYPELGTRSNEYYPKIKVYVCIQFATIQPAPAGNMVVHSGGPRAMSGDCLLSMGLAEDIGAENVAKYNIIAFDQRGMGRSEPSFAHEECTFGIIRNETGSIIDFVDPRDSLDATNATSIENYLDALKRRVVSCWTCENCGFRLNATQPVNGNVKTYHFLQYSGTRQLAEDMERFRRAINAKRLTLYGASYGTTVMGTYATLFPDRVHKLVLDASTDPGSDLLEFATAKARGEDQVIDYMIYSCSAQNVNQPGSCPVEDMAGCISDINNLETPPGGGLNNSVGPAILDQFPTIITVMFAFPNQTQEICQLAEAGDADNFFSLMNKLLGELYPEELLGANRRLQEIESDLSSQPSHFFYVWGKPEYLFLTISSFIEQTMVFGQDTMGHAYDNEFFLQRVDEINQKYDGAGSHAPANSFIFWYGLGFYWPKCTPLPPRGNPSTTGIVSGQIFDAFTPYFWTQSTRESFRAMHLLSSQSIYHGMSASTHYTTDPSCQVNIQSYLETGEIDFVDGTTCGAPFPTSCEIVSNLFGICFE